MTDLVVIVPGLLGSRLMNSDGEIWNTSISRLLFNVASMGRRVKSTLRLDDDADPSRPDDGVGTNGLITGISAIPGLIGVDFYDKLRAGLIHDLELTPGQLIDFPYDWRLSCRVTGKQLAAFLDEQVHTFRRASGNEKARAVLVCHSLGGLVARWCADQENGAELISNIITIGTPHKGAIMALDAIANGVRLPRKVGIDMTAMALSFPSLYEMLPTYSCVDIGGTLKSLADADTRTLVRASCPVGVANLDLRMTHGMDFHSDLLKGVPDTGPTGYELICLRGTDHPTNYLARCLAGSEPERPSWELLDAWEGELHGGDNTVASDSGVPGFWQPTWARDAAGRHSTMASGPDVRERIRIALRNVGRLQDDAVSISVSMPTECAAGAPHVVTYGARVGPNEQRPPLNLELHVQRLDTCGPKMVRGSIKEGENYRSRPVELVPGFYRQTLVRANSAARKVPWIEDWLVVYDPQATDQ